MWHEKRTTVAKTKVMGLIERLEEFAKRDREDWANDECTTLAEYHRGRGNGFAMAARWMRGELCGEAESTLVSVPFKPRSAQYNEKWRESDRARGKK